jgi:dUTPase
LGRKGGRPHPPRSKGGSHMTNNYGRLLFHQVADGRTPVQPEVEETGLLLRTSRGIDIDPRSRAGISSGTAFAIPRSHIGLVIADASLVERGLLALPSALVGTSAAEVVVYVANVSSAPVHIDAGEPFAHLVVVPFNAIAAREIHDDLTDLDSRETLIDLLG